jgi:hypothetical protein
LILALILDPLDPPRVLPQPQKLAHRYPHNPAFLSLSFLSCELPWTQRVSSDLALGEKNKIQRCQKKHTLFLLTHQPSADMSDAMSYFKVSHNTAVVMEKKSLEKK